MSILAQAHSLTWHIKGTVVLKKKNTAGKNKNTVNKEIYETVCDLEVSQSSVEICTLDL